VREAHRRPKSAREDLAVARAREVRASERVLAAVEGTDRGLLALLVVAARVVALGLRGCEEEDCRRTKGKVSLARARTIEVLKADPLQLLTMTSEPQAIMQT